MRSLIVLIFTISSFSMSLFEALKRVNYANPEINLMRQDIKSEDFNIINSSKYKNPILFGGVNDISLSKPFKRDLEPMQTAYIGISQEIETNGKLILKTRIATLKKRIKKQALKDAILQTKLKVYNIFYIYKNNRKKISLFRAKIKNLKKIESYHKSHDSKMAYLNSLNIKEKIGFTKLNITKLKEKNAQLKVALSEIVNKRVKKIEFKSVPKVKRTKSIRTHPIVTMQYLKKEQKRVLKELYIAKKVPNITLSLSYNYRKNYRDYINLGFKLPLPVRGREEINIAKAESDLRSINYAIKKFINILKREKKIAILEIKLAKESIKVTNSIIDELKNQKILILEDDSKNQTIALLKVENQIIEQKIKKIDYLNQIELNRIKLRYFGSNL